MTQREAGIVRDMLETCGDPLHVWIETVDTYRVWTNAIQNGRMLQGRDKRNAVQL